jgi:hypothetical protein
MVALSAWLTPDKGIGVYADEFIPAGVFVLEFEGPLVPASLVPWPLAPQDDHYLQVGPRVFRGPTDGLDNLVNHSCDPNTKVVIDEYDATLVSLRDILAGEEITFDYSTTSTDPPSLWTLDCRCGTARCRRTISGFLTLSSKDKARYVAQRAVPKYVIRHVLDKIFG